MFAKLRRMMFRVEVSDYDLELIERACRSLADIHRRDAEVAKGTSVEAIHRR
jgi:hypothetical protein